MKEQPALPGPMKTRLARGHVPPDPSRPDPLGHPHSLWHGRRAWIRSDPDRPGMVQAFPIGRDGDHSGVFQRVPEWVFRDE